MRGLRECLRCSVTKGNTSCHRRVFTLYAIGQEDSEHFRHKILILRECIRSEVSDLLSLCRQGDLVCACAKKASSRKHRQVRWQTQEPSDSRVLPRQGLHRSSDNPHSRPPRTSERHPERRPGATNVPADARRGAEAPRTSEETTDVREPPPRRCRGCGVQMEAGSIISDLFVGIHESTIICLTSGTILCRTHERYTSLTLAVNLMGETDLVVSYVVWDVLKYCT